MSLVKPVGSKNSITLRLKPAILSAYSFFETDYSGASLAVDVDDAVGHRATAQATVTELRLDIHQCLGGSIQVEL